MTAKKDIVRPAYRPWLPDGALDRPATDAALADAARRWSAKWFAQGQVRPLGAIAPLTLPAGAAEWLALEDGPAIALQTGTRDALAAMMLDGTPDARFVTDADRAVAYDLSSACIDDLCRRIAQLFRLPGDSPWSKVAAEAVPDLARPRGCGLGADAHAPLLHLLASTELMIALVKSGLPPPTRDAPLPPRLTGLATQRIALAAALGRCRLSLVDFAGLEVGDVLVFDRATSAPLDLCIGESGAPIGKCTVARTDDRLDFNILEPLGR